MAALRSTVATLAALCLTSLLLVSVAEAAAAKTKSSSDDDFADTYVSEDGEKRDVADPIGDPSESDSIQEDAKAAWQLEMVKGLYAQRKAEKDFIDKLEAGGKGLNVMVNHITAAFKNLEDVRQRRGSRLIKAHFENEIKLLKQSSQRILKSLTALLTGQSSDSPAVKAIKTKASAIFSKGFSQQLQDESNLFKKQMQQIQAEHTKQNSSVQKLFALLKGWKDSFQTGLKKSEKKLESIAESWDLL
ncbi:uncharacterized protein LOC117652201 [Thrips palmi]|uniref:Uncharacterized protein LOC117652201 n=1 Tax=Thrips palmi TaxID=161013 RepID=A0A6P9A5P2_THRPL|nr:uncharacterized protein LOC117652201 [Thrips palmi]